MAQAVLFASVPTVGPALSFLSSSMLCSLYCFEYCWINAGAFVHESWVHTS
jgi:hypothetical protein